MAKIGFLLPEEEMIPVAESLHREEDLDVAYCKKINTPDTLNEARSAVYAGAQILIARGYQAKLIKRHTEIPLVEIQFTIQELGLLIQRAKSLIQKDHPRILFMGFDNMLPDISHLGELFDVDFDVVNLEAIETAGSKLKEYMEQKQPDALIGGREVCHIAEEAGILSLIYRSTEESIKNAIVSAKKMSFAIDAEQNSFVQFEAAMESSWNGLIRINNKMQVIVLNQTARTLLEEDDNAIGQDLSNLLPDLDLDAVSTLLTGETDSFSTSIRIGDATFSLLVTPIMTGKEIDGAILSFRAVDEVRRTNRLPGQQVALSGYRTGFTFQDIKTTDPDTKELLQIAKSYSLSNHPVLIVEKTGFESAYIARAMHNSSSRYGGPFVSADLWTIPKEKQLEVLFEGIGDEPSALQKANYGTLFIDHIEELTLDAQHMLLRSLRSLSYLHSDVQPLNNLNNRVIARANKNIDALVKTGEFNSDLYYRLSGLKLQIKPLKDRPDDLIAYFDERLQHYNKQYHQYLTLTEGARDLLTRFEWEGNRSQVDAFCEHLVLTIRKRKIDEPLLLSAYNKLYPNILVENGRETVIVVESPEGEKIKKLLTKHNGNRAKVAQELGISTTTLWRHMKKYGIEANYK